MTTEQRLHAQSLSAPVTWTRPKVHPSTQYRLLRGALIAMDAAALALAIGLAYLIRFKTGVPFLETPPHTVAFYSSVAFWSVPAWLAIFALYRLYDRHYLFTGFQEYARVINGCTVGMVIVIFVSFIDIGLYISRGWLLIVWATSVALVGGFRFAFRRVLRRVRSAGFLTVPTVIVGANEEGRALAEQFLGDPGAGIRILGFIGSSCSCDPPKDGPFPILGGLNDLERVVQRWEVGEIIVAPTALTRDELLDLYRSLGHSESVEIRLSSGLFEILTTGVSVQEISCVPLVTPQRVRITGVDAVLKAVLDYTGALVGLILLSPVMLAVAILVKLDSPGPVLYRRRVLGRFSKPFDAFKFRTMVVDADNVLESNALLKETFSSRYKLKSDPRVTRIGRILRRTSLDELPQLFNVLRGEMSLVGPRMISPDESGRYGKWQLNLLTVRPGITGPWQVRGRSEIPYEERVQLSMHYIRNFSIWLDLEILLRTIPAVLKARGAY